MVGEQALMLSGVELLGNYEMIVGWLKCTLQLDLLCTQGSSLMHSCFHQGRHSQEGSLATLSCTTQSVEKFFVVVERILQPLIDSGRSSSELGHNCS